MSKRGALRILLLLALICFPSAITSSEEVVQEVYLLVRAKELLAFSAIEDRWVAQDLRPKEKVVDTKYDGNVVVVFTTFRVLGFSALTTRWDEEKLMVDEAMVSIEAKGNVGAAITNLRALGFSAKTGRWIVRRFGPK